MRIWPLLVLLAASPALADEEDAPVKRSRSFQGLSIRFADREIDDTTTSFEGAALSLGRRFGAYTLYVDGELGYQHDKLLPDGLAAGVGLHARRRICGFELVERHDEIALPCWVDVGVGWSTLFTGNATLSRPVISLGVGGGMDVASKKRRGGMTLGITVELAPVTTTARRLAPTVERTTEPTAIHHIDAGVRFDATFLFGAR